MSQDDWSDAIIIVGAGLSGGSAALTILQNGGRVILVEKEKKLGGNSVRASSGINAAETIHQKNQKIKDSVDLFAQDTAYSKDKDRSAKPTSLIWALAKNSADAVHWIEENGLNIPVLSQCGGHSAARTHRPLTGAAGGYITLGLLKKVREYESKGTYKEIKQAKMTKLLKNKDGRVNGIEYSNLKDNSTQQIRAACVIVTTGGFCFNKQLLKKYAPHVANLPTTNGPWTLGEGMLIAQSMGAKLVDMECIQVHPTGFVDPAKPNEHEKTLAAECLRAAGALLINEKGRRFVNELGHRDDVTAAEKGQKGQIRLILNPLSVKEVTPHVNMYKNFFKVLKTYKNAQELATEMKIPVENLIDTFETYNEAARKGWCPSGKDRFPGVPYKADQELTVGFVVPVLHYVMGGILINEHAQVISENDKPILGLFASGETTGGLHGRNRLAGNSLVDCVVYGRIAANSALNYSKQGNKQSKL